MLCESERTQDIWRAFHIDFEKISKLSNKCDNVEKRLDLRLPGPSVMIQ